MTGVSVSSAIIHVIARATKLERSKFVKQLRIVGELPFEDFITSITFFETPIILLIELRNEIRLKIMLIVMKSKRFLICYFFVGHCFGWRIVMVRVVFISDAVTWTLRSIEYNRCISLNTVTVYSPKVCSVFNNLGNNGIWASFNVFKETTHVVFCDQIMHQKSFTVL